MERPPQGYKSEHDIKSLEDFPEKAQALAKESGITLDSLIAILCSPNNKFDLTPPLQKAQVHAAYSIIAEYLASQEDLKPVRIIGYNGKPVQFRDRHIEAKDSPFGTEINKELILPSNKYVHARQAKHHEEEYRQNCRW